MKKLLLFKIIFSYLFVISAFSHPKKRKKKLTERLDKALCTIASKINVTPKGVRLSEKLQLTKHSVVKFDRSKKFDLWLGMLGL